MRRGSSGCWSAGLGMDRTTTNGNTRSACWLAWCTGIVDVRGLSHKVRIRRSMGATPMRRDGISTRQEDPCLCMHYV